MDFGGVRALVVLPEFPVPGGAVGGAPASVLAEDLDDCRVLAVESFVPPVCSLDRALVVLPESVDVLFDFLLLDVPVLLSPAAGVSPVGGVALAEGSVAALFFGLLVAVGVLFAFSPAVPALSLLVGDLLREEVVEAPEPVVVLSVPAARFESLFFLVLVFFEVVDVSPELACGDFVESVESAAGFFFFFFAAESLCDGSVDCVDWRKGLPCNVLVKPNPSKNGVDIAIKSDRRKFFFMAVPPMLLESSCVIRTSR